MSIYGNDNCWDCKSSSSGHCPKHPRNYFSYTDNFSGYHPGCNCGMCQRGNESPPTSTPNVRTSPTDVTTSGEMLDRVEAEVEKLRLYCLNPACHCTDDYNKAVDDSLAIINKVKGSL